MKITQYLIVGLFAACIIPTYVQGNIAALARNSHVIKIIPSRTVHKTKFTYAQPRRTSVRIDNGCPKGFVVFRDSCFSQSLAATTWNQARVACEKEGHGGDLASIHSKEELDFLKNQFGGGKNELRWIGLHKDRPLTAYKWTNGDKVRYLPWASNYTGQERSGFVPVSLSSLHFLPQTSPKKLLPFICGTRRVSEKAGPSGVAHANQAVPSQVRGAGQDVTGAEMHSGKNPMKIMKPCTKGWESFEGKCYKAFNEKRSYKDAIATCKKQGANLLSLHSHGESEFVRKQVMRKKRRRGMYWLGLSNGENGMQWSDGSPFDYSNRIRGSSQEIDIHHLEKCLKMDSAKSIWEIDNCDEYCFMTCIKYGESVDIPWDELPSSTTSRPTTKETKASTPSYDEKFIKDVQLSDASAKAAALNKMKLKNNVQKSASQHSQSEGETDQKPVILVLVGSVGLAVAGFGAISWRRRYGNYPCTRTSLLETSTTKNHNTQSVTQLLRDTETSGVHEQGIIYGAME